MTEDKNSAVEEQEGTSEAPILQHLTELRNRLLYAGATLLIAMLVSYAFSKQIFLFLAAPLIRVMGEGRALVFLSPAEALITYLKVSAFSGLVLASPMIFYHLWKFTAPGLHKHERKMIVPFVVVASLLFAGGALFCYYVILPYALNFMVAGFEIKDKIEATISLKPYLSFTLKLMAAFGLSFELPIFSFFLARMGLVSAGWLIKNFRYAIVVIVIVAAILTPPDVVSQIALTLPLLVLYWISVGVAHVFARKKD